MLEDQGLFEVFQTLDKDQQISYVERIAAEIQDYVNTRSYEEIQCVDFNSQERQHKLGFKSEKVNKAGLWVTKKRYCIWCEQDSGVKPKESLQVTGLETIKSSTPTVVKPMITDIMTSLLTTGGKTDTTLELVRKYKNDLKNATPDEIAENLAVHDINKYISVNGAPVKGTPRHTKGVLYYRQLCKQLGIENKAENIDNDDKVKTVYVKPNPLGIESLSFISWMDEFNTVLELDYDKMIEKLFTSKVKQLFDSAQIEFLESEDSNKNQLSNWFE